MKYIHLFLVIISTAFITRYFVADTGDTMAATVWGLVLIINTLITIDELKGN